MHPKIEHSIKEGIFDIIKNTDFDQQRDKLYEFFINKLSGDQHNINDNKTISSDKEIKEIVITITRNNKTGVEIAQVFNKDKIAPRDILWWLESMKIEVLETANREANKMIIKEQAEL